MCINIKSLSSTTNAHHAVPQDARTSGAATVVLAMALLLAAPATGRDGCAHYSYIRGSFRSVLLHKHSRLVDQYPRSCAINKSHGAGRVVGAPRHLPDDVVPSLPSPPSVPEAASETDQMRRRRSALARARRASSLYYSKCLEYIAKTIINRPRHPTNRP